MNYFLNSIYFFTGKKIKSGIRRDAIDSLRFRLIKQIYKDFRKRNRQYQGRRNMNYNEWPYNRHNLSESTRDQPGILDIFNRDNSKLLKTLILLKLQKLRSSSKWKSIRQSQKKVNSNTNIKINDEAITKVYSKNPTSFFSLEKLIDAFRQKVKFSVEYENLKNGNLKMPGLTHLLTESNKNDLPRNKHTLQRDIAEQKLLEGSFQDVDRPKQSNFNNINDKYEMNKMKMLIENYKKSVSNPSQRLVKHEKSHLKELIYLLDNIPKIKTDISHVDKLKFKTKSQKRKILVRNLEEISKKQRNRVELTKKKSQEKKNNTTFFSATKQKRKANYSFVKINAKKDSNINDYAYNRLVGDNETQVVNQTMKTKNKEIELNLRFRINDIEKNTSNDHVNVSKKDIKYQDDKEKQKLDLSPEIVVDGYKMISVENATKLMNKEFNTSMLFEEHLNLSNIRQNENQSSNYTIRKLNITNNYDETEKEEEILKKIETLKRKLKSNKTSEVNNILNSTSNQLIFIDKMDLNIKKPLERNASSNQYVNHETFNEFRANSSTSSDSSPKTFVVTFNSFEDRQPDRNWMQKKLARTDMNHHKQSQQIDSKVKKELRYHIHSFENELSESSLQNKNLAYQMQKKKQMLVNNYQYRGGQRKRNMHKKNKKKRTRKEKKNIKLNFTGTTDYKEETWTFFKELQKEVNKINVGEKDILKLKMIVQDCLVPCQLFKDYMENLLGSNIFIYHPLQIDGANNFTKQKALKQFHLAQKNIKSNRSSGIQNDRNISLELPVSAGQDRLFKTSLNEADDEPGFEKLDFKNDSEENNVNHGSKDFFRLFSSENLHSNQNLDPYDKIDSKDATNSGVEIFRKVRIYNNNIKHVVKDMNTLESNNTVHEQFDFPLTNTKKVPYSEQKYQSSYLKIIRNDLFKTIESCLSQCNDKNQKEDTKTKDNKRISFRISYGYIYPIFFKSLVRRRFIQGILKLITQYNILKNSIQTSSNYAQGNIRKHTKDNYTSFLTKDPANKELKFGDIDDKKKKELSDTGSSQAPNQLNEQSNRLSTRINDSLCKQNDIQYGMVCTQSEKEKRNDTNQNNMIVIQNRSRDNNEYISTHNVFDEIKTKTSTHQSIKMRRYVNKNDSLWSPTNNTINNRNDKKSIPIILKVYQLPQTNTHIMNNIREKLLKQVFNLSDNPPLNEINREIILEDNWVRNDKNKIKTEKTKKKTKLKTRRFEKDEKCHHHQKMSSSDSKPKSDCPKVIVQLMYSRNDEDKFKNRRPTVGRSKKRNALTERGSLESLNKKISQTVNIFDDRRKERKGDRGKYKPEYFGYKARSKNDDATIQNSGYHQYIFAKNNSVSQSAVTNLIIDHELKIKSSMLNKNKKNGSTMNFHKKISIHAGDPLLLFTDISEGKVKDYYRKALDKKDRSLDEVMQKSKNFFVDNKYAESERKNISRTKTHKIEPDKEGKQASSKILSGTLLQYMVDKTNVNKEKKISHNKISNYKKNYSLLNQGRGEQNKINNIIDEIDIDMFDHTETYANTNHKPPRSEFYTKDGTFDDFYDRKRR